MVPKILGMRDELVLSDSEECSSEGICINNNGHSGSITLKKLNSMA
jgi:hypothetical protein